MNANSTSTVAQWCDWSQDLLSRDPFPDLYAFESPWSEIGLNVMGAQELCDIITERLTLDSGDFVARYVGLSATYMLSKYVEDVEDLDTMSAHYNEDLRLAFARAFKTIAKYRIVAHCADW